MTSGVYERTPDILEAQKKYWEDPEYHRKHRETMIKVMNSPEIRNRVSEAIQKIWTDSEYRRKVSEANRKRWADPEHRSKQSETISGLWGNSDYRENQMEKRKSPDFHNKISESLREAWADKPLEQREKERELAREITSKLWEDPKFRERHTGENHWSWKGGIRRPYKGGWLSLRDSILTRDNNTCQLCGVEDNLCPHHIDYDIDNMDDSNLITLCVPCNSRVNSKREYWTAYFREKMEVKV